MAIKTTKGKKKIEVRKKEIFKLTPAQIKELESRFGLSDSWNPEIGEKIFGKVVSIKPFTKKFGKRESTTNIMELVTSDGTKAVWCKTVIQSKMDDLNIVVGSIIGIEYLGKVKKYHSYNVAIL